MSSGHLPSADYVGVIRDIVEDDAGVRFVVVVQEVLHADDGDGLVEPGAQVSFVIDDFLEFMFLASSSRSLVVPTLTVEPVETIPDDEMTFPEELGDDAFSVHQREGADGSPFVDRLIGGRIRVVYEDPIDTPYTGRLAVWLWPEPMPVVQYVGRLKRVAKGKNGEFSVRVEVTRVLLATPTGPRPGDVVEFALSDRGQGLGGMHGIYPGMESDFRDEFRVVYFGKFESPYTGPMSTTEW